MCCAVRLYLLHRRAWPAWCRPPGPGNRSTWPSVSAPQSCSCYSSGGWPPPRTSPASPGRPLTHTHTHTHTHTDKQTHTQTERERVCVNVRTHRLIGDNLQQKEDNTLAYPTCVRKSQVNHVENQNHSQSMTQALRMETWSCLNKKVLPKNQSQM